MKATFSAVVLAMFSVGAVLGQGSAGAIAGRVTDVDGEVVPNGSIQARNTATAAVVTAPISAGNYALNGLPPGTYDLSIAMNRFVPYTRTAVTVEAGHTSRVDITMRGLQPLGDDITAVSNDMRAKPVPTGATPRMPDGKPDLSGIWLNVVDGNPATPLPLQPWADKIRSERGANNSKDMPRRSASRAARGPDRRTFPTSWQMPTR